MPGYEQDLPEARILLVEDSDEDAKIIESELRGAKIPFVLRRTDTRDGFIREISEFAPDVILADYSLSTFDGISALAIARVDCPHVPFIFVSGALDESTEAKLLYDGAADYVPKNRLSRLGPVIFRVLRERREVLRRKEAEEKLRERTREIEAILHTFPDLYFRLDATGVFIDYYGTRPADLYAPPEVFLGKRVQDLLPEQVGRRAIDAVRQVIETGAPATIEYSLPMPGGEQFYEARLSRVSSNQVIAIVRNITGQRQIEEALRESFDRLRRSLEETVNALASAVEKRDPYTARHEMRVTKLARAIAKQMGLSPQEVEGIPSAGILHDIGKLYVPAEILSKPGRLTEPEMTLIRTHSNVGYDILKAIPFGPPVALSVLQHHERLDGSGYPNGLSGSDIILEARILAVADVVEAMTSHRPYRPALGLRRALEEVSAKKGTLYDPRAVNACLALFRKSGS